MIVKKKEIPPRVGVTFLWELRWLGLSNSFLYSTKDIIFGITKYVIIKAPDKSNAASKTFVID